MNQQSKGIIKKIAQLPKTNGTASEDMDLVFELTDEYYKKLERGS